MTATLQTFEALLGLTLSFAACAGESFLRIVLPTFPFVVAEMHFGLECAAGVAEHDG